jgi:hypothetical protein
MFLSSTLWHSPTSSAAQEAGSTARLRDAQQVRDHLRDHNPGHTFRPVSFETLGRYSEGAIRFIREVAHGAFPGAQSGRVPGRCFSNMYGQLAGIRRRYTSRMITAAAGLNTAHTGSSWVRGAAVPEAGLFS